MIPENDREFEAPICNPDPSPAPNAVTWLYCLYLRPRAFFAHFPRLATPFTIAYSCWILGILGVMDRLDQELLKQEFSDRQTDLAVFMESWASYWAFCGGLGVVAAAMVYGMGGWWYRKRLCWCGAVDPDADLARRVYILASMVYAWPAVLLATCYAISYDTPQAAYDQAPIWLDLSPIPFLFWSVFTSHRGARTLFDLGTGKARIWFLLIPGGFYFLMLAGGIGLAVLAGFLIEAQPPDLESPHRIVRPGFSFRYPGNWEIVETDPDYDPDAYFTVQSFLGSVAVTFDVLDEALDPLETAREMTEDLQAVFPGGPPKPFGTWGTLQGEGLEYLGSYAGEGISVRTFSFTDGTRSVVIQELVDEDVRERMEPGLELIRQSFHLNQN